MPNVIPYESLENGIQLIKRNVNSLLETATLLYSTKKYLHSAIFSVIAIEEMAKALVMRRHCDQKKDVPYAEWTKITMHQAHYEKWKIYMESLTVNPDALEKLPPEVTKDDINNLFARFYSRTLKLGVLYVDWDKRASHWNWYPEYHTETQQEEISHQVLESAKTSYAKLR